MYREVEDDAYFTPTAWMIVAAVTLLSSLGSAAVAASSAAAAGLSSDPWIIGAFVSMIFAVAGFALGAFVISWAGKTFFNAETSFEEMVRVLGLAYVWNTVGFLGILAVLGTALTCITGPVAFLAAIAGLISWFIAAKEALDLEWPQTIGTVILGWVAILAVTMIAGAILGIFGLAGAGIGAVLRGI